MIRILIVEDQELSLENVSLRLREELAGAEVRPAKDITDAEKAMEDTIISGYPFDVIVADVKVPVKLRGNPEANPRLTTMLEKAKEHGACILQMTAYWDKEVADNIIGQTILKTQADWPGKVVTAVAEQLVMRHLRGLYGTAGGQTSHLRTSGMRAQSLTYRLADAVDDIAKLWHLLGPKVQEMVREHFIVEAAAGELSVRNNHETRR